jgi:hypothetical protein
MHSDVLSKRHDSPAELFLEIFYAPAVRSVTHDAHARPLARQGHYTAVPNVAEITL